MRCERCRSIKDNVLHYMVGAFEFDPRPVRAALCMFCAFLTRKGKATVK